MSEETCRYALEARCVPQHGGGACTILVRRIRGRVEVLFHADPETGATMTDSQAVDLAKAIAAATESRTGSER